MIRSLACRPSRQPDQPGQARRRSNGDRAVTPILGTRSEVAPRSEPSKVKLRNSSVASAEGWVRCSSSSASVSSRCVEDSDFERRHPPAFITRHICGQRKTAHTRKCSGVTALRPYDSGVRFQRVSGRFHSLRQFSSVTNLRMGRDAWQGNELRRQPRSDHRQASKAQCSLAEGLSREHCLRRWSEFIQERDGHRCVDCHSRRRLSAHHICRKSFIAGAQFETGNGITLCRTCHTEMQWGFNVCPDLSLPADAQGGEKLAWMERLYSILTNDTVERPWGRVLFPERRSPCLLQENAGL